jgi:hypothetical protein
MTQAIVFVSTCPNCKREQPQDAFSVELLRRLLGYGHLIEAYCVTCDELWPISTRERYELAKLVVTSGDVPAGLQVAGRVPDRAEHRQS